MLEEFLKKQEIGITLLQEITKPVFDEIRGFVAHTNIGATGRGTAIITRNQIQLTNIVRLPTGRGMAARPQNVTMVNIHAPSGAEKRKEIEQFFPSEIPLLLQYIPKALVMGGDYNCVLSKVNVT